MSSLVRDLQQQIVQSGKTTTELLRIAKLISVKLDLNEITSWVNAELSGYSLEVPDYRVIVGGDLQVYHPFRGWEFVGHIEKRIPVTQSVSQLEALLEEDSIVIPLSSGSRYKLRHQFGGEEVDYPQQVSISSIQIGAILDTVKNRLLDWSAELEARGILGENMSFEKSEKTAAHGHVFNIQNATGVFGNIDKSTVTVYDYSTLHQVLKDEGLSQEKRNELENIMDELKQASSLKKRSLLEKAKQWIVDNEKFLGASAEVVRKVLGLRE